MRRVIVRYTVKPERIEEHIALINAVFAELEQARLPGVRYAVARAKDGVSFTHIAAFESEGNPLNALAAFKAFQPGLAERCDQAPTVTDVDVIGDHGLFGDTREENMGSAGASQGGKISGLIVPAG